MKKPHKTSQITPINRRLFLFGSMALAGATGCRNITRRGQSPDESAFNFADPPKTDTRYIGQITGVWGNSYATVEGIGLAGNLAGTGSNPKPGWQSERLVKDLQSRDGIDNPKTLISSDDTSMVLVKGYLPPGIRKGDNFDLAVRIHAKSDTTSLHDGQLSRTRLRTMAVLGRKVREGHVLGIGQGSILIDSLFESRQDQSNHVRGWVLGGGIALEDRPLGLTIRTDGHTFRQATAIADAINERFTTIENHGRVGCAVAKTDKLIDLKVPTDYKHNIARFLQVVQNTAFDEDVNARVERMGLLDQELNDPATCATAAVRLESLGEEGVPALTRALKNPDLEVRFRAAQALAYMGEEAGVETLHEAAEIEPAFRWHALAALATLKGDTSREALSELLHMDSAETRYGAFRSLKAHSPFDPSISGEFISDFFFHTVPTRNEPMVHLARSKQPEIVLFGEGQTVSDELLYVESGLTIKGQGNGKVKIVRYLPGQGEVRKVCSAQLIDLVPILAELGCSYTMVVKFLRDTKQNDMLNSRLVIDAVPKRRRKYRGDSDSTEKSNRYVADPLPELFRPEEDQRSAAPRDDVAQLAPSGSSNSGTQRSRRWGKLSE